MRITKSRKAARTDVTVNRRGTYKYRVILQHPTTKTVIRHWDTDKERAYADADMLASPSMCVDVRRVRIV